MKGTWNLHQFRAKGGFKKDGSDVSGLPGFMHETWKLGREGEIVIKQRLCRHKGRKGYFFLGGIRMGASQLNGP